MAQKVYKSLGDQSDDLLKEAGWTESRIRNAKRTNAKKHPGVLQDYQKENIKPYPELKKNDLKGGK